MNRRQFIYNALATGSSIAALSALPLSGQTVSPPTLKFGFISNLIKHEMQKDWQYALARAASFGYRELEISSPPDGVSASDFVQFCGGIGLKIIAGGVKMTDDADVLRRQLDEQVKLGLEYAVCYWPWNVGAPFSLENCEWSAPTLNQMGSICREYGLGFCWHNHDKEFQPMEKGLPWHYLMEHTDPDLVSVELDVYWAAKGGADPVHCLKDYAGRFRILHLKDMTAGDEQTFECVGSGILDFPALLEEAGRQDILHFILEKDKAVDGLGCLQSAMSYLKTIS